MPEARAGRTTRRCRRSRRCRSASRTRRSATSAATSPRLRGLADRAGRTAQRATTHWWGGAESQNENILDVASAGTAPGAVVDFWTWYFIEDGWDYGYVEALVDGEWVTVPLYSTAPTPRSRPTPTRTTTTTKATGSPGPPAARTSSTTRSTSTCRARRSRPGTTDVRFRYSTDAAYLDTGFFVDDVTVGGAGGHPVVRARQLDPHRRHSRTNNWVVQLLSPCDLTPGTTSRARSSTTQGNHVYRFEGDSIHESGFSTRRACAARRARSPSSSRT